ncbi:MAG: ISNCY family transposase, partial [Terriglobales bacterium]
YGEAGARGLVHGNAGKRSHRARPEAERQRVLELVREHYGGARGLRLGPTLAAEELEREHGLRVGRETLRRWMLGEGLWSRGRKRRRHRQRRERKAHFGELVQMDGSEHRWLEERAGSYCLLDLVDDASGRADGHFAAQETIWAAADGLRRWVERHGVPLALYTDHKNVYVRPPTSREALRGEPGLTQFGSMCARLGIGIIAAGSPQAKGRIERGHGTHQDRLVKKMRLRGIADYAAANR